MLQPSALLASCFLALSILALLILHEEPNDDTYQKLKKLGWQVVETINCKALKDHRYYEIETATKSRELYVGSAGNLLLSPGESVEMDVIRCHPIKNPSFVEEI